ncbi:MAG: TolC family protein [Kiritimatiellia bacterium]
MSTCQTIACGCALAFFLVAGCRTPQQLAESADKAAALQIEKSQEKALGAPIAFTIEKPSDALRRRLLADQKLPGLEPPPATHAAPLPDPFVLSLNDALKVGAAHSREYQAIKENVFQSALALDLEADAFRNSFAGALGVLFSSDNSEEANVDKITGTGEAGLTRKLKAGGTLTTRLAFDLAQLLTGDRDSSAGISADASVSIPLLRGAGRAIAMEPLTQAERDLVYAIRRFERYKQDFAIRLASDYLSVLQQLQAVKDATSNLDRVQNAFERARRMADAGRLEGIQVDQARQDVLRAESRLNAARQSFESSLDDFKLTLGLPGDARIALVEAELTALSEAGAAEGTNTPAPPIDEPRAIALALTNRLDLLNTAEATADAERAVTLSRDALRAGLTFRGGVSTRDTSEKLSADDLAGLSLRTDRTRSFAGLDFDAPWERTAQRNNYRASLIALERARRDLEAMEDRVKLDVREGLRNLAETRQAGRIQALAVDLARTRVNSTEIYLQAGRAEIRDVLEAQAALVSAQDALTRAIVDRRLAELNLQRSLGVLQVNPEGLWREYNYSTP